MMTRRDEFAAAALQGLLAGTAGNDMSQHCTREILRKAAQIAVEQADLLIEELDTSPATICCRHGLVR